MLVRCCISLISPILAHMDWQGCQHMYGWLEFIVYHTPPKVRVRGLPVLSIHAGPSLESCVVSMDGIPLLDWSWRSTRVELCACAPTSREITSQAGHPNISPDWKYRITWILLYSLRNRPVRGQELRPNQGRRISRPQIPKIHHRHSGVCGLIQWVT